MKKLSTSFNWHCVSKISASINEERQSSFSLKDKKRICTWNSNKLVFAHLNINSIWKHGRSMISETKIADSFPYGNFLMDSFSSPYRLDWDSMGGIILLYPRENPIKFSFNRNETNWRFLYRVKSAKQQMVDKLFLQLL